VILLVASPQVLQADAMQEAVVGAVTPPRAGSPAASKLVSAVELVNVTRRFGEVTALVGLSVEIHRGEFFSVLGPSGCGKTTLLRLVGGLDLPDAGVVRIGGRDACGIPAHERPVNTVFQSYALFPHLSVRENIAFGLRMKKVARAEMGTRVDRALELVQITELASRLPSQISGGQKQRVALARALVNEPEVLLLDEPLGALDVKLRKELQAQLRSLQRSLGLTFIYVTHDQEEALALSDRIAVMNAGRIEQIDSPEELYRHPCTRYVAQFLGSCNLIEGTVQSVQAGSIRVRSGSAELSVQTAVRRRQLAVGESCTLAVRPEQISLTASPARCNENCLPARVREATYAGPETQYLLDLGRQLFTAKVLNASNQLARFRVGDDVTIHLPPAAMVLLED
jgi:spermidine/putrescine transport system ATP-binding protein